MCDNPRGSLPMNKIREILLTEYIGAILVALLVSDAIIALISLVAGQIFYHAFLASQAGRIPAESQLHSILTTLVKMLLYLASAYMLVRWLYGTKPPVTRDSTESLQVGQENV